MSLLVTRLKLLETLLNASTTTVPISQLSVAERYELFINVLRGLVPIRGSKIRDFPMSRYRFIAADLYQNLCQCLHRIQRREHKKKAISITFTLIDFISLFFVVELATRGKNLSQNQLPENDYFNFLIISLIKMVCKNDENHSRTLSMLLGLSNHEFDRFFGKREHELLRNLKKETDDFLCIAQHHFLTSNIEKEIEDKFGINNQRIIKLKQAKIKLISIKTKKVQDFLSSAKNTYILRGLSYWCSQIMSLVRDIILQKESNSGIFIDSDSVIIIISSANRVKNHLHKLEKFITSKKIKKTILNKYPRLLPYIDDFTINIFPPIGIIEKNNISLFELATEDRTKHEIITSNENTVIYPTEKQLNTIQRNCSHLWQKKAIDKKPEWYNLTDKEEGFSFESIIFSLAEINFRQQTLLETKYQLDEISKQSFDFPFYHSQTIKSSDNNQMSFIKYDGDNIGAFFTQYSLLLRSTHSFNLESKIKQVLIDALCALSKENQSNHIVHDLIYIGGDDLFISIPRKYEQQFIKLFDLALEKKMPEHNHTFAILRLDISSKEESKKQRHSLVASLINDVLEYSKYLTNNRDKNNSLYADIYQKHAQRFTFIKSKGIAIDLAEIDDGTIKKIISALE